MRWLLRLLVSDADRRTIDSDLAELFELRRRQRGERAARRWLRRQRVLYPLHLLLEALRAAIYDRITTMNHLWRDIRYSIRSLARTPAVAVTIMLTVGIALGATAAMVGIVRAVLVDPLPFADPARWSGSTPTLRHFASASRSWTTAPSSRITRPSAASRRIRPPA